MLLAANFLLQLAFLHLYVTTYLTIFNWVWNDVRVRFRTLLRALLSSFVILLVTTHSDEQLGQSSFLIRIYIRVIWFTRNTRLRRIWPTKKQNRRTSVPTLSLRSHTLKWRPKFPACRSILIAKDCGGIRYWQSSESNQIRSDNFRKFFQRLEWNNRYFRSI